ncbi:hypothetical protein RH915_07835 [Serpentinicella sp. ANB-PHB4]|uniref:hypothetical protein n=1 Tax=Serpentinicella sp. ANB-PHB4 TaxID=3074076 RepID=UPI00285426C9|nr:hypothetical protein [Serpentinicella sp. ANB-PHB4]MDR5659398.1 hypothetical protein [Serpentinicella sp. ANB-PHB4]
MNEIDKVKLKQGLLYLFILTVFGGGLLRIAESTDNNALGMTLGIGVLLGVFLLMSSFKKRCNPEEGNVSKVLKSKETPLWVKTILLGILGLGIGYFIYFILVHVLPVF